MRRFILFTGIFLLLAFLSCDKKDTIKSPEEFPEWLQNKGAYIIRFLLSLTEAPDNLILFYYNTVTAYTVKSAAVHSRE